MMHEHDFARVLALNPSGTPAATTGGKPMTAFVIGLVGVAALAILNLTLNRRTSMAIRSSTQAILDKIAALKADDQAEIDAAVAAAVAERDAAIAADSAEDQEQVDAINAALDASALTPNADQAGTNEG